MLDAGPRHVCRKVHAVDAPAHECLGCRQSFSSTRTRSGGSNRRALQAVSWSALLLAGLAVYFLGTEQVFDSLGQIWAGFDLLSAAVALLCAAGTVIGLAKALSLPKSAELSEFMFTHEGGADHAR